MTNAELQRLVEEISLAYFQIPFRHHASFNSRLRTTGGRYVLKTHNLEFNPKQYEAFGMEELTGIIKHELCHYHLHLAGKGYKHKDTDFKQLLRHVGGSRYCRSLEPEKKRRQPRYALICKSCGMKYLRQRKMDVRKYVCGKCKGKLTLEEVEVRQDGTTR